MINSATSLCKEQLMNVTIVCEMFLFFFLFNSNILNYIVLHRELLSKPELTYDKCKALVTAPEIDELHVSHVEGQSCCFCLQSDKCNSIYEQ